MFLKKEKKNSLYISSVECRILIRALLLLKESQIKKDKAYDSIDQLIVKLCDWENERCE